MWSDTKEGFLLNTKRKATKNKWTLTKNVIFFCPAKTGLRENIKNQLFVLILWYLTTLVAKKLGILIRGGPRKK